MTTSVTIDTQHREEVTEQAQLPVHETQEIQVAQPKSNGKKPNYELLAAQFDEINNHSKLEEYFLL